MPDQRLLQAITPLRSFTLQRHDSIDRCAAEYEAQAGTKKVAIEKWRSLGFYGFADTDARELHYWIEPNRASVEQLVNFFAHEIAHLELHPAGEVPQEMLPALEREASVVGAIAQQALMLANTVRRGA